MISKIHNKDAIKHKGFYKFVIEYVMKSGKIKYLQTDGKFGITPYRYFEGDDVFPLYTRAKWCSLEEASDLLTEITGKTVLKKCGRFLTNFRIVKLKINLPVLENGSHGIPTLEVVEKINW